MLPFSQITYSSQDIVLQTNLSYTNSFLLSFNLTFYLYISSDLIVFHMIYKRLILYKLVLHGYPFNHTVFSYLYISSDLIVFQMIYKTKQITRFMTKHFLKT